MKGFARDGVWFHTIFSEISVAGGRNCHLLKGVEVGVLLKEALKFEATFFQ